MPPRMGLVTGVSHLLILAEVLHGCSSIISLSLRCVLRCNRAKKKKKNLLFHNTLSECLSLGWLRVTLHLAYGFALLICLQLFSDGIFPDLTNCQTVESHNDSDVPSSGLWGMFRCGVLEVRELWVKHVLIHF